MIIFRTWSFFVSTLAVQNKNRKFFFIFRVCNFSSYRVAKFSVHDRDAYSTVIQAKLTSTVYVVASGPGSHVWAAN